MKAGGTVKDLRVFGIAMGVVLGALGAWQFVKDRPVACAVLVSVAAVFLVVSIVAAGLLRPLYMPWMKFAFVLGFVMTRVILCVFYFLVITPYSLVRWVLRKDSLERSLEDDGDSWWQERDGSAPPPERYERQF